MKQALIIFTKEPEIGKVKTRITPFLSESKCLSLYKAFLKDSLSLGKKVTADMKILAYDSGKAKPTYLSRLGKDFNLHKQKGRSLGEKMHDAFLHAKDKKASKIVMIGTDCPTFPKSYIEKAFRMLDKKDVVLGPALDGGYYLMGLKKPCFALFRGIKWSTNSVLKDTIHRARKFHNRIGMLKAVRDIDKPEDLIALKSELKKQKHKKNAKWTRKFLKI